MISKCIRLFRMALVALGISALSLFAIPLLENRKMMQYIIAGFFWISFAAELLFLALADGVRKKIDSINPKMKSQRGFGKIGLVCFFQNREATMVDLLLLAFIASLAAMNFLRISSVLLVLIGIVATFVFLHLHSILNGILYKSIKRYQKVIHKRRERK